MSTKLVAWVLDDWHDDGKCGQFKTMVALAEWADADGVCFPSVPTLAHRIGRHESNARKLLVALAERGELIVAPPKLNGGGHNAYLVVGTHTGEELVALLKNHKSLKGRVDDPGKVVADTIAKLTREEAGPVAPPEVEFSDLPLHPLMEEGDKSKSEKPERLTEGEFTAEKELSLLLSGSMGEGVSDNWDGDYIRQLQLQFGRLVPPWPLKGSHQVQLFYLQHATGWEAPGVADRTDWMKTFSDHEERFKDPALIGDLYAAAWARLQQQREEAQARGKSLSLTHRPGTLTNTMRAIHDESKEPDRAKGLEARWTPEEINAQFSPGLKAEWRKEK